MGIWYCTREDVQQALDAKSTARDSAQIDRQIEAESRGLEGFLHRVFYPQVATRDFDWPNDQMGRSWRLWLDANELFSASTITSGGATLSSGDYFLEPQAYGPPYNRLEIDLSSQAAFTVGDTHQRAISIEGIWAGAPVVDSQVGSLTADLDDAADATATITWSTGRIGVGDLLLIDDERCVVTARTMVDSTQDTQAALTASAADGTVSVTNGGAFATDTVLLIGGERMLVVDIAGNDLVVKRAWDGSTLAAHDSGASVFTLSGVELDRAVAGTTLAAHTSGTAIKRWVTPGLVRQLCIGEVINTFEQEKAGYARSIGAGDNVRNASGGGIKDLRDRAYTAHGRKARIRAV